MIDGAQKYCLIQKDFIPATESSGSMPLIDFADLDRDAMSDLLFYKDGAIYSFYNKYVANDASSTNLCKGPSDGESLFKNPIFSSFAEAETDKSVSNH